LVRRGGAVMVQFLTILAVIMLLAAIFPAKDIR
jgi:hypothetical protein